MKLSATIASSLWVASSLPAWKRFHRALNNPAHAQQIWLREHLRRNATCGFAKKHQLASMRSYEEFARCVPLMDYKSLEPWIERIRRGEKHVLVCEPVTHLLPTSGSTGARKLIPFTAGLQHDFNRAIGPWICDLARTHPSILGGPAYWSISPAMQPVETGTSQVPVGFADDASYLGGVKGWLVRAALIAPADFALDSDIEPFRFETLRCLLRERELRLISIWHPSFLTLLLDVLPDYWERLLAELPNARQLRHADPRQPETLWPHLRVISCWGNAHAEFALADLRRRFPTTTIQPKGLLATEAIVTIPFSGQHPLAVRSHFFEFIDETGRIRLSHELHKAETYELVVTTSGGLWRYRLGDLVRVEGFVNTTPALRFLGRAGNVSDLCGEKLSEAFVADAIHHVAAALKTKLRFALLAPEQTANAWHYNLYLESNGDPSAWEKPMEAQLRLNPHYDYCRQLGQLEALRICPIESGAHEMFLRHEISHGKRLGEVKTTILSRRTDWAQQFLGVPQNKTTHRPIQPPSMFSTTP